MNPNQRLVMRRQMMSGRKDNRAPKVGSYHAGLWGEGVAGGCHADETDTWFCLQMPDELPERATM